MVHDPVPTYPSCARHRAGRRQRLFVVIVLAVLTLPALADGNVMARIADGGPWTFREANGRAKVMVLNPDGSGRVRAGRVDMRAEWTATHDGFCLRTIRAPERCMVVVEDGRGFLLRLPGGDGSLSR